jgi:hypothetical protein
VSVDSAWLSFSSSPKSRKAARDLAELKSPWAQNLPRDRHVNIVAGRATLADRTPRLYAYVHKLVPSAPARLDQFLFASGVAPDERVTVISDDAGEFGKAVDGSQLARGRILDWFHIAMKFKAAKNSVLGSQTMEPHERIAVETEIDNAKSSISYCKSGATRPPPNASSSACCIRALYRARSSPISCAAIRRQKPRSRSLRT